MATGQPAMNTQRAAALLASVGLWFACFAHATGVVTAISGQAKIQRPAGLQALPVGAQVADGDVLSLTAGSTVELLCGSQQKLSLSNPVEVVACGSGGPAVFSWAGRSLPAPRGDTRVLLPVGTLVNSVRPSIRWTPASGSGQVRVAMKSGDVVWNRVVADSGRMDYPADALPLDRGKAYRVLVLAVDQDPLAVSGTLNSGFRVSTEVDAARIEKMLSEASAASASPADQANSRARVRILTGLVAEAIDELEKQIAVGSATAMTNALLGRAWLLVGCYSCAVAPLEKAFAESSVASGLAKEEAGILLVDCYRQLQRPADVARIEALSASAPKVR